MQLKTTVVSSQEVGELGVWHLKRLWHKSMLKRQGLMPTQNVTNEWDMDKIVIFGLGLALEETLLHLLQAAPTYPELEQWVLQQNGGVIAPNRIARINAAIAKLSGVAVANEAAPANEHSYQTPEEPVLSAADLAFWDEHGYVIVRDAVTPANAQAAERAIWEFLGMNPQDPETWYSAPRSHQIMTQFYHHPALQANRDAPRIHTAFAQLWETDDLWATIDRVSFNPPERPGWKFPGPHLHWDTSLNLPIPFGLQGILYLTATAANQGAFTCVPGFHRTINDWLPNLPPEADPRQQDLAKLGAKPIAAGAGDLIIWHHALPHGSSPNAAQRPRIVQYITLFPTQRELNPVWK